MRLVWLVPGADDKRSIRRGHPLCIILVGGRWQPIVVVHRYQPYSQYAGAKTLEAPDADAPRSWPRRSWRRLGASRRSRKEPAETD